MKKAALFSFVSAIALFTASCASATNYDKHDPNDPYESFNRVMFDFNMRLDKYILKPVAKGYRAITTPDIRERVRSAFNNIKEPISAVNQLLQGEFKRSGTSVGRFVVNSTLGLAGTFDVASAWGLEYHPDGFEETLAKWCVPSGPYLVLPFIGSTTPRAFTGEIADSFTNPVYWLTEDREDGYYAYAGYIAVKTVINREAVLDLSDDLQRNSVDFYTTMKSAYMQNKSKLNSCSGESQASYDFDFEIDEEVDDMEI